MTMRDFAKKYGLNYWTVRDATFHTNIRERNAHKLDFEEKELKETVKTHLEQLATLHEGLAKRIRQELVRIEGGGQE